MSRALISISDARAAILQASVQMPSEPVPIGDAVDRVLASDVIAAADVPPFGNSAMDGFAVGPDASRALLRVVGESRAGTPAAVAIGPGEAIHISTGAPLPEGTAAVVPVEQTAAREDRVEITADVRPGQHLRGAGEDLQAGATVLRAGTRLTPGALAVAVGAGAGTVTVARRPRVAVLCTGDELREPGAPLGPGEIHNSNAPMLQALAAAAGAEVVAVERVADSLQATERAFAAALQQADVVIASGGVSVGPHDHVKPALTALGVEERFWRVALQPGKPTWFGTRGEQLVLGLPGNPVSSYVTFLLFARPALLARQGHAQPLPPRGRARLTEAPPRREREQALRVRLDDADGTVAATPTGAQGSHITGSLAAADALLFVPAGATPQAGDSCEIERI
ncbi:molybdopterin molybdotransferase MoeA [Conexibacter sp. JD483]|uniref:molybdopterin molybdotransferase MoeA n=1 Tax=Conexibacter sp. JD483 TaxID=3064471 RepID=UPI002719647E|nr:MULTISPECIES: gephyrin-like molybdotransferase Glp [unclassified Conexibacter]MDO8188311.1 molybdopterin molybdotransferase MoeA [Conexibacter sp. CPCC 205706]MDO8198991.1 molybdopterin molybdotransferase MoeA [Conexibacter sp. CPCC 205762]MDR9372796.1 molybdopterin molybdotransferase MoeA [Conexibacter sp. JD483]